MIQPHVCVPPHLLCLVCTATQMKSICPLCLSLCCGVCCCTAGQHVPWLVPSRHAPGRAAAQQAAGARPPAPQRLGSWRPPPSVHATGLAKPHLPPGCCGSRGGGMCRRLWHCGRLQHQGGVLAVPQLQICLAEWRAATSDGRASR